MKNILARGGIEFLAVLLGISASLWIDNSVKEKELYESETEILTELLEEIILNEDGLNQQISSSKYGTIFYERMIKNWGQNKFEEYSEMDSSGNHPYYYLNRTVTLGFNPIINTYESFENDGKLKNISNIKIRALLSEFYLNLKSRLDYIIDNENVLRNEMILYIIKNYPKDLNSDDSGDLLSAIVKNQNDYVFKGFLIRRSSQSEARVIYLNRIKESLLECKTLIENELKYR